MSKSDEELCGICNGTKLVRRQSSQAEKYDTCIWCKDGTAKTYTRPHLTVSQMLSVERSRQADMVKR